MKLKTFENFEDSFLVDLIDFCEVHLAYLLDDSKYTLQVMSEPQMQSTYKIIVKTDRSIFGNIDTPISWVDIKDHVLHFYHMLEKNYDICQAPDWMIYNSKGNDNYIAILPTTIKRNDDSWRAFSAEQLEYIDIGYLTSVIFYVKSRKTI